MLLRTIIPNKLKLISKLSYRMIKSYINLNNYYQKDLQIPSFVVSIGKKDKLKFLDRKSVV